MIGTCLRISHHHMTVISKLAWCVYSFLDINILARKLFNFSLNGILHEVLIFLFKLVIRSLSYNLLPGHIWRGLHPYARSLSLLSLVLLVIFLLQSWGASAISKVIMHDLSPFSLSLYTSARCCSAVVAVIVFLFLETYILQSPLLGVIVLLSVHACAERIQDTHRSTSA